MAHNHKESNGHHACCDHSKNVVATQSIDEMDFERGIWSAALYNDLDRLEKLCNTNHTNDRDNSGYTALHYASRQGHIRACQLLLDHDADVNATTCNLQQTALHRAAMMGHLEVCKLLLAHRASVNSIDEDGKSALHRVAEHSKNLAIAKLLLKQNETLKMLRDKRNKLPVDYLEDNHCTELKALLAPNPGEN